MLGKKELDVIDEEIIGAIFKATEIFDVIKNTRIKIGNILISKSDKKYLSLLLGINDTNNSVSKILRLLRYNYNIQVHTTVKKQDEYEKIYNNEFSEIVDSLINVEDSSIENLMMQLLEVNFIKQLHNDNGLSLIPLRLLLHESLENKEKPKTLQKV